MRLCHQSQERVRPTFKTAWLGRNSDRLSFRFRNLTRNRTTDTTTHRHTAGYARPAAPNPPPVACQ